MSIRTELLEFAFIIIIAIIVVKESKLHVSQKRSSINTNANKHFLVVASQIQITPILIDGE